MEISQKTIQDNIKLYFKEKNKHLPAGDEAMGELSDFASFMIQKTQTDLQDFVDNAIKKVIAAQRTPNINEVYMNTQTGQKIIIDAKNQLNVQRNRENYFFICKYPHHDGDYSYQCKNNRCKCNENEFIANVLNAEPDLSESFSL